VRKRQELVMNTPLVNPNDPKWTAYVLDELDAADRASVERLLETSPEARALVNDLKASASVLDEALTSESPELVLTAAQRAAVTDEAARGFRLQAEGNRRAGWFAVVPLKWSWGLGAVAAAAIVAAIVLPKPPVPAVVGTPAPGLTAEPTRPVIEASQNAPQTTGPAIQRSTTRGTCPPSRAHRHPPSSGGQHRVPAPRRHH
jgi:anti-sigma factor RsiW